MTEAELLALIDESPTSDQPADTGTGLGPVQVPSGHSSIAISRALGSVVVAVHGSLDLPGARHLGTVLADIIDGQGNLAVIVDLQDASAPDASGLTVLATERAGQRGANLTFADPPDDLHEPLTRLGLARLVPITHHQRSVPPCSPGSVGSAGDAEWPRPPDGKASHSGGRVLPPILGPRQAQ